MTLPLNFYDLFIIIHILLCLLAAVSDVKNYTIPNRLVAYSLVLFVVTALLKTEFDQTLDQIATGILVLAVGFILFSLNIFGAGDAKMLSIAALWAGSEYIGLLLIVMSITGGILGITYFFLFRFAQTRLVMQAKIFLMRHISSKPSFMTQNFYSVVPQSNERKLKLPYGVAIASAVTVVSILQIFMTVGASSIAVAG